MKCAWILNHYAAEPSGPGGTRHFQIARHLVKSGWQVVIIAANIEHLTGRDRLAPDESFRTETFEGVIFHWIRVPAHSGNGGGRLLNMLAYSFRSMLRKFTRNLPAPDIVVGSSVHPFAAVSGCRLARRFRVPFVFEVRDLWPQTLIDLGRLRARSATARLMRMLETWLYRKASWIIVLLPRAADYIVPLGISAEKITWVSNGVDLENFPDPGSMELSKDPASAFTLMYFGAHGNANGLDTLLHAMRLVANEREAPFVKLRLIGDGPAKPQLRELALELGLDTSRVSFEDPVAKDRIPSIASEADAFVICVLDKPGLYRYGISMNKLFDYLAARRPVLIASAAINNPVADADCGITVPPGDPEALAAGIVAVARSSCEQRRRWGDNARKHVEAFYGYEALAESFGRVLDEAILEARGTDSTRRASGARG